MKPILVTLLLSLAALIGVTPITIAAPPSGGYIVVFHDHIDNPAATANEISRQVGGNIGFIYQHALKGFSITVPPQAVAAIERNPKVKYVATDDLRYISAQIPPTGIQRIFADTNTSIDIDSNDDYRVDVDVAVLDTGIDFEHPDLNVVGGVNCATGGPFNTTCGSGGDDDHYHGTHVAGTIAALDNDIGVVGVAPGARLWSVKVLNSRGSGYASWIVAGIDWIAANGNIEVANMSLGGPGFNQAEYDAIQGAVEAGVAFVVAAGNDGDDANNYSPAAFDNVLTVSALADFDGAPGGFGSQTCRPDQDDTLADFSNWGSAVDIAAPGVCIRSTYPLEQGEYGTISGTSMASPHVAGALALLASSNPPSNAADVYDLYDAVIAAGNDIWTDDSGDGYPEPLLDVSNLFPNLVQVDQGSNQGPTAEFTYSIDSNDVNGLTVNFTDVSDDSDGYIGSWFWNFGDGNSSTIQNPSYSYQDYGTYTVTLTVTDDGGVTGTYSQNIPVDDPNAGGGSDYGIDLTVIPRKVRGTMYADLVWTATDDGKGIDIYRDGSPLIENVVDNGEYTDANLGKGGGTFTYHVCNAGSIGNSDCSDTVTVEF
ncbi:MULTISPECIES: S8 family serine peptidase [Vibrio]|uniref:S8 family serine peptidase n=1 Tax=Vibrio TaxID=662 RepID=UPI001FBBCA73|nr:S8 family serine peptidase [Vibrio natriegens]MEE3876898.1 S8 family serine peptidase [Vibrio sp. YYF0003]